ncbi:MAG: U32 family peptidase [Candidatus Sabulitectum sp.]|nr:U32 family peptidase [Candidatus Sabulitectum sp.]
MDEAIVEIMAPAGSYESLMAAVNAGATSIYFGVGNLNMRSKSANFELDDLVKVAGICSKNKVRSYLTLNTIMYDEDLLDARKICDLALSAKLSAVIASDISVIEYARSIGLEVHISTQMNVANVEAVKFYSKYADVIVLARELSLGQIEHICDEIKRENICGPSGELVKIEVFIHGALCVAISGKCYMSLAQYNSSANRGKCLQTCRRRYRVIDEETDEELIIDNKFVMSPKDMCTIKMLDKLIDAGVGVLKIEGRARGPEYVDTVVKQYRKALTLIAAGEYDDQRKDELEKELKKVFNRGFWENGYYLGKRLGDWSGAYGSQATTKKILVGRVVNFYKKVMIVEILVESGEISIGDQIAFTGTTTGIVYSKVDMILDSSDVETALLKKGSTGTIKLEEVVRRNDKVFLVKPRNAN